MRKRGEYKITTGEKNRSCTLDTISFGGLESSGRSSRVGPFWIDCLGEGRVQK